MPYTDISPGAITPPAAEGMTDVGFINAYPNGGAARVFQDTGGKYWYPGYGGGNELVGLDWTPEQARQQLNAAYSQDREMAAQQNKANKMNIQFPLMFMGALGAGALTGGFGTMGSAAAELGGLSGLPSATTGMTEAGWGMGAGGLGGDAAGMAAGAGTATGGAGTAFDSWNFNPAALGGEAVAPGFGQTTPFAGGLDTVGAGGLQIAPYTGGGLMDMLGNPTASLAKLMGGGGGASSPNAGGSWMSPNNLMSIGSGIYGLYQSNQLKKLAEQSSRKADPWGDSGGRDLAGGQLKSLMLDPSAITKLPGYEAGMEAVRRSMAAQGYQGSTNMAVALQKYGGDFYNNAIAQLAQLAGVGFAPGTAASIGLGGATNAASIAAQSLNRIGYGAAGGTGSEAAILQRLLNKPGD